MVLKPLDVAVGIILNAHQEVFITQRAASSHMGGYWEFPGGKVEKGETPAIALQRELLEETGIMVQQEQVVLVKVLEHAFSDRRVILHFYLVEKWENKPFGREGQRVRWIRQDKLKAAEFPPANAAIIQWLTTQSRPLLRKATSC